MTDHTHFFIPVATTDWPGNQTIIAKCSCALTLEEAQRQARLSGARCRTCNLWFPCSCEVWL